MSTKNRILKFLIFLLFGGTLICAIFLLLNKNLLLSITVESGPFGIFILGLVTFTGQVIIPINSAPIMLVSTLIYGPIATALMHYISSLLSATVAYFISKRYGRKIIYKFVGQKALREIDEISNFTGEKMLWMFRLLGFSLFEFVSYAFGLSNIKFKTYIKITAIGIIPWNIVTYLIIRHIEKNAYVGTIALVTSLSLSAIIFQYYWKKYKTTHRGPKAKAQLMEA